MGGGEKRPRPRTGGSGYEPREDDDESDEDDEQAREQGQTSGGGKAEAGGPGGGGGAGAGGEDEGDTEQPGATETGQQPLSAYGGGLPGGINPFDDGTPGADEVDENGEGAAEMASYWGFIGVVQVMSVPSDGTDLDKPVEESLRRIHDEALEE